MKRPHRHNFNRKLPTHCINCEDRRKYIKNSIELFHHFSNPKLNRRWICQVCESENNSVAWHCIVCDSVSYLAPIYKETLIFRQNRHHHKFQSKSLDVEDDLEHSSSNSTNNELTERERKNLKGRPILRRTRSLSMDSGSSCRNLLTKRCHICLVNNCKNIFNVPPPAHSTNTGTSISNYDDVYDDNNKETTLTNLKSNRPQVQQPQPHNQEHSNNIRLPAINMNLNSSQFPESDNIFNSSSSNTNNSNTSSSTHNHHNLHKSLNNLSDSYFGKTFSISTFLF